MCVQQSNSWLETYEEEASDQDNRNKRLLERESARTSQNLVVLCLQVRFLEGFVVGWPPLCEDILQRGLTIVSETGGDN